MHSMKPAGRVTLKIAGGFIGWLNLYYVAPLQVKFPRGTSFPVSCNFLHYGRMNNLQMTTPGEATTAVRAIHKIDDICYGASFARALPLADPCFKKASMACAYSFSIDVLVLARLNQ